MTTTVMTLEDSVRSEFASDVVSPYAIIKVINKFRTAQDMSELPTQMGYNYTKNGLINGRRGDKKSSKDEAVAFVVKYLNKNVLKTS